MRVAMDAHSFLDSADILTAQEEEGGKEEEEERERVG
jgi:hypothetical protein